MTGKYGITGFGAYVPRLRLQREAIAQAHAWMAPSLKSQAKGQRAFCSWDEDAITMAVEAGRNALGSRGAGGVGAVYLASTTLPYADLQNASIAAAAIGVGEEVRTIDLGHSQRGATSGLIDALRAGTDTALFIASERPIGRAASVQEMQFGAGAAALTLGTRGVIAECIGSASRSELFIDHFRAEGRAHDYVWEERWVRDEGYMRLVPPTIASALASAGVGIGDVHHLVFASPMRGVVEAVAKQLQFKGQLADTLAADCGYTGSAHALLMLSATLEAAQPGELILLVGFGQGCDALVLRATPEISGFRPRRLLAEVLADRIVTKDYLRMLSFHGGVDLEWGMRAERDAKTALTEVWRSGDMLSHFHAGRCGACATVQFPQLSYCVNPKCKAPRDGFEQVSLRDEAAQVMTFTADWLSYYAAPPLYVGFTQFRNGARLLMETVDVGPEGLQVGMPLRMVYRIKERDFQRGFDRYFWKATPVNVAAAAA